jgi:rhodanese-related sulfurtransferase
MSSNTEITAAQLARLVGTPVAPIVIDVRSDEDFASDPRLIPGSVRADALNPQIAGASKTSKSKTVVVCRRGGKLSQGAAAWLRHAGVEAETLEGGFDAWRSADGLLLKTSALPESRDARGRTVWVTRARPKVDRIACPWLIRRFVDPEAVFLFVSASEVGAVAERFSAAPFDVEDVFWSHRGDRCTFDTMIEEFGLAHEPLDRLALIVRAADTGRPELSPQAPGFLAASLGLSRMFRGDLEQLDAGMLLYDAFYRWCRDAVEETHNWPSGPKAQ